MGTIVWIAGARAVEAQEALSEVSVFIHNPFKGRPREELIAKKEGEKVLLLARIAAEKGGEAIEGKAVLTDAEWRSILKVVADQKLLEWKPEPGPRATDTPVKGFAVKGKAENAKSWDYLIQNEGGPKTLMQLLASLAAGKKDLEKVPLRDLRP